MPSKNPTAKLTAPMRMVLERMEKGAVLFQVKYPAGTVLFWGDVGRDCGLTAYYLAFQLAHRKLVHWNPNERFYRITPAGRRALKEGR